MTDSCMDEKLNGRLSCILTYHGSERDIMINYIVLIVNLICCVVSIRFHSQQVPEKACKLIRFALLSLISVAVFQICLCLVIGCAGISIIWCAMAGWMVSEHQNLKKRQEVNVSMLQWEKTDLFVFVLNTGVIIFYAFVTEPITTVAHSCALVLGVMLSMISIRLYNDNKYEETMSSLVDYN